MLKAEFIFTSAIVLACAVSASGATVTAPALLDSASLFKSLFAVPDAPAFVLVTSESEKILRPTTARDLSVAVSDFSFKENDIILPRAFAAEFSPGLMIGGKSLTLTQYQQHPWLYRARLSLATSRPGNGSSMTSLAIGLRTCLTDNSDLRMNHEYIDMARELSKILLDSLNVRIGDQPPSDTGLSGVLDLSPYPDLIALRERLADSLQDLADRIRPQKADRWNGDISEYAFAFRLTSPDSLGNNLKPDIIRGWATWGRGIEDWGQLLIGLSAAYSRYTPQDQMKLTGSLGTRFYVGVNKYKVFAEGEWTAMDNRRPTFFLNAGGEINISGNIWIDFSAGTEYVQETGDDRLVTDCKLKYGI